MKTYVSVSTRLLAVILAAVLFHTQLAFAAGAICLCSAARACFAAANGSQRWSRAISIATASPIWRWPTAQQHLDSAGHGRRHLPAWRQHPREESDFDGGGRLQRRRQARPGRLRQRHLHHPGDAGQWRRHLPGRRHRLGKQTGALVVGDFNGDGKPDLAMAGAPAYILLGNGNGTFQTPIAAAGDLVRRIRSRRGRFQWRRQTRCSHRSDRRRRP